MRPPLCCCFFFSLFSLVPLTVGSAPIVKMIVVDSKGGGDFTNIQQAVTSIPSNNNQWIQIYVKAGVYKENVNIPMDKGFIVLQGDGAEKTSVEAGNYADSGPVSDSATFITAASNIVVKGITFKNTFRLNGQTKRAVAALIGGDKTSFHNCGFIGIQDTLCDLFGRHYYEDCYIEGGIDFIWGYGQSIFERCTLSTVAIPAGPGYVTAQGRDSEDNTSGFVFKSCKVMGLEKVYLGRAWGGYSRVVFYQSFMSDIVVPQGWDAWNHAGNEGLITFVESGCSGPGSNTSDRVSWENKIGDTELKRLTDLSFIDDEGWLAQQPN